MERTKQLVLSAFKPIFGLTSAHRSEKQDETRDVSITPPSYNRLSLEFPDAADSSTMSITDQAQPIRLFPSELPPRPQKESTLAFRKRKTTYRSRQNFSQTLNCPSTLPEAASIELSPISVSSAVRSWKTTRDDDVTYFTPPTSPISSINIGKKQTAEMGVQGVTSSSLKSHEEASRLDSIGKGKQVLPPTQPMQSTIRSTSTCSCEPILPESDRLPERFAKLKTGNGAPALVAQLNPSLASSPSGTTSSHTCGLQIPPSPGSRLSRKRIDSLVATPTTIRGQSILEPPGPAASPSSTHGTSTSPESTQRSRNESQSHRRVAECSRKVSHTTQHPPNSSSASPLKTSAGNGHPQYPDLSVSPTHTSREMSLPRRPNAAVPDTSHPEGFAAATQEKLDRSLAEALQQAEDEEYDEILAWLISLDDDHPDALGIAHTKSSGVVTASNSKSAGTGRRDDPIDLISESSEPGNWTGEKWGAYFIGFAHEPDTGKGENAAVKPKRKKRRTAANRVRELEDCMPSQLPASTRRLDCAVCGDSVRVEDTPALGSCSHAPQTCRDCFASWIKSELDSKGWRSIKCPGSGCRVMLSHEEVQRYASKEVFSQYDTLTMRAALSDDPDFRWCRAAGCSSGQIHLSGEDGNIFRCNACGHRVCVVHDTTFHEGETCQEYDYRISGRKEEDQRKQEEASERAVKKLSKKCPGKGCSYSIQKNDGCDHMTCTQCQHEFCFECLADYNKIRRKGNGAHKKSCKYHSSRIEAYDSD